MVAVFVGITLALGLAPVRQLDLAVRDLADAHRPYAADLIAQNLNRLGSGGLLTSACLVLASVIGLRRRSWWPLAVVGTAFALTGAVIQPLKLILHRPAPHAPLPDDVAVRLFAHGESFPSGHAVNTVVWYAVIGLLLAPWLTRTAERWLRLAPPVIVTVAGTYLGYHWLTDMLAGLALAVPLSHVLTRLPWPLPVLDTEDLDAGG
jgi:membrane-associated phospholipid phosphatase